MPGPNGPGFADSGTRAAWATYRRRREPPGTPASSAPARPRRAGPGGACPDRRPRIGRTRARPVERPGHVHGPGVVEQPDEPARRPTLGRLPRYGRPRLAALPAGRPVARKRRSPPSRWPRRPSSSAPGSRTPRSPRGCRSTSTTRPAATPTPGAAHAVPDGAVGAARPARRLPTKAERASYKTVVDTVADAVRQRPRRHRAAARRAVPRCVPHGSTVPARLLAYAARTLSAQPHPRCTSRWARPTGSRESRSGRRGAGCCVQAGVPYARGFALDTSHFDSVAPPDRLRPEDRRGARRRRHPAPPLRDRHLRQRPGLHRCVVPPAPPEQAARLRQAVRVGRAAPLRRPGHPADHRRRLARVGAWPAARTPPPSGWSTATSGSAGRGWPTSRARSA